MYDLSIVLPTCNRGRLLEKCLSSIISGTSCSYEIIIVDGASTDSTQSTLTEAQHDLGERLKIIREPQREGFVRAANKGFRAATGRNLTWLNDDARVLPGTLDAAVQQIDQAPPDVAFVAMFHAWHSPRNVAYELQVENRTYRLCHVRGTLYANFPVGKRETFEKLGYFDERYFVAAADPDLSLKAWCAGMKVVPAYGTMIDHDELSDLRRQIDNEQYRADNEKLFAKWLLPPKSEVNDFDPLRPCTCRGLREPASADRPAVAA
ncbi:MAG: glycosyltransferase [Phycisphaerae bacterium]|nr:glycosyltransferase [Phycisphaerae bacterium]MDW8261121.1 glycosyltransferase [Phycisphaerales bacterium]